MGRAFAAANRSKVTDFLCALAAKVTLEQKRGASGGTDGRCGEPHGCLSPALRKAAGFLQPLRLSHVEEGGVGGGA